MAKTILIVDDSASLRQVVAIALKGGGYDVLEACDGKDALGKLSGQKIHLIISDVNMPNMNGIEFVKAVKQLPVHANHHAHHREPGRQKAGRAGGRRQGLGRQALQARTDAGRRGQARSALNPVRAAAGIQTP